LYVKDEHALGISEKRALRKYEQGAGESCTVIGTERLILLQRMKAMRMRWA
jgi:hypothetical protein